MAEISFEIKETIGVLSESKRGWTKEVNMVSLNGRDAKIDIREWDATHEKMGKGLTFTSEEVLKLRELLNNIEL
ncbi:MAG: hypothetical protein LBM69_00820 [Lachnospiraceae bacterium]|nr:hypothetical protein [Lachnospiraceae bacterium]